MIASQFRFHGHKSIGYVHRKGQGFRGQYFAIKTIKNSQTNKFRAAVVVSKKISKSAVVRNSIRRRIYESVRLCQQDIAQGSDIVVTVYNSQIASLKFSDLQKNVSQLLKTARVI